MRKTAAVSFLQSLDKKPPNVRSLLSDISILVQHEDHSIQNEQKYRDDVSASSDGRYLVITVDYKSNTEVPRWRGDVFDSYAPPTVGIFGIRVDHEGSTTYIDLVTLPVSHSAENALFLLEHGLFHFFNKKSIDRISLEKVSIWADCARHFRCGSFVHGALSLFEGSYFLTEERSVYEGVWQVMWHFRGAGYPQGSELFRWLIRNVGMCACVCVEGEQVPF